MNENSDRPGIAEILIEKHRNGPVGKIDLRFDEEKTTFLSIDKSDFGDFTPESEVETEGAPSNHGSVEQLVGLFQRFPGIGPRQAQRSFNSFCAARLPCVVISSRLCNRSAAPSTSAYSACVPRRCTEKCSLVRALREMRPSSQSLPTT